MCVASKTDEKLSTQKSSLKALEHKSVSDNQAQKKMNKLTTLLQLVYIQANKLDEYKRTEKRSLVIYRHIRNFPVTIVNGHYTVQLRDIYYAQFQNSTPNYTVCYYSTNLGQAWSTPTTTGEMVLNSVSASSTSQIPPEIVLTLAYMPKYHHLIRATNSVANSVAQLPSANELVHWSDSQIIMLLFGTGVTESDLTPKMKLMITEFKNKAAEKVAENHNEKNDDDEAAIKRAQAVISSIQK